MASSSVLFSVLCLLALSGAAYGMHTRALKTTCACADLCADVANNDPEKNLRACVDAKTPGLCYCRCGYGGDTLLHESVPSTCGGCVDLLVNGATQCYVDVTNYSYVTPLTVAARACNSVMVNRFLNAGANPNYSYYYYDTPICAAARQNDPNCGGVIRDLVNAGADICRRCYGALPYDLATNPGVKDIIEQEGGRLVADGGTC